MFSLCYSPLSCQRAWQSKIQISGVRLPRNQAFQKTSWEKPWNRLEGSLQYFLGSLQFGAAKYCSASSYWHLLLRKAVLPGIFCGAKAALSFPTFEQLASWQPPVWMDRSRYTASKGTRTLHLFLPYFFGTYWLCG